MRNSLIKHMARFGEIKKIYIFEKREILYKEKAIIAQGEFHVK